MCFFRIYRGAKGAVRNINSSILLSTPRRIECLFRGAMMMMMSNFAYRYTPLLWQLNIITIMYCPTAICAVRTAVQYTTYSGTYLLLYSHVLCTRTAQATQRIGAVTHPVHYPPLALIGN